MWNYKLFPPREHYTTCIYLSLNFSVIPSKNVTDVFPEPSRAQGRKKLPHRCLLDELNELPFAVLGTRDPS